MFVTKIFNENHWFVIAVLPQNHGFTQEMGKEKEKTLSEITIQFKFTVKHTCPWYEAKQSQRHKT